MSYSKIEQYIKIKNNKVDDLSKTKQVVISIKHHNHQWRKFTFSGGGEQSLLNVRQNFQISDIPPPPFALEKTVFSPLLGQNFLNSLIFRHCNHPTWMHGYAFENYQHNYAIEKSKRGPQKHRARGRCHLCHMVNPALYLYRL
jgi:hypothetical protein